MSQALQMRGSLGICSDSSWFRVSQWALLTWGTAQSHPPAQSGCHLLCFFFGDLFPQVQNFCNQRHHGVAVQAGSCSHMAIPGRERGRMWIFSEYKAQHSSIPVAQWPGSSCISEGSGQGGWCCRMHRDSWQIAWHCWELGTEPGNSGAEGEEMCPRLPAQLVSSFEFSLFSFAALLWFSLLQHPAAAFSAQPRDVGPSVGASVGSLQAVRERIGPCSQGMDWPWIHSPDVKDQEFLLLQAALHNSVRVSLPTA